MTSLGAYNQDVRYMSLSMGNKAMVVFTNTQYCQQTVIYDGESDT